MSRNYQEMRERLRLRLNMKKSAKCKTAQNASNGQTTQEVSAGNAKSQSKTGGTQSMFQKCCMIFSITKNVYCSNSPHISL